MRTIEQIANSLLGLLILAVLVFGVPLSLCLYVRYLIWAWGATA